MANFKNLMIEFFIGALIVGTVVSQDPSADLVIHSVDIMNKENPYFGEWKCEIESEGRVLTFQIPIKKQVPEDAEVVFELKSGDTDKSEFRMSLCEGLQDQILAVDVLACINGPSLSKDCPIKPGAYVIKKFKIPSHKIPLGTPDGEFEATIIYYIPSEKREIGAISVKGKLSHKTPGLGR